MYTFTDLIKTQNEKIIINALLSLNNKYNKYKLKELYSVSQKELFTKNGEIINIKLKGVTV